MCICWEKFLRISQEKEEKKTPVLPGAFHLKLNTPLKIIFTINPKSN